MSWFPTLALAGVLVGPPSASSPASAPSEAPTSAVAPPTGIGMRRTGLAFIVLGSLHVASGSAMIAHASELGEESPGFLGIAPLGVGGPMVLLGALLQHYGQERRWAYAEWARGREPAPRPRPRSGTGMLVAGPLSLAVGATLFGRGLDELRGLGVDCEVITCEDASAEWDPAIGLPTLIIGGLGMLAGTTLTVLGARQRTRYMSWRAEQGRPIRFEPTAWFGPRGVGGGLRLGF